MIPEVKHRRFYIKSPIKLTISGFVAGVGAFAAAHILYGAAYFHRFCVDTGRAMSFNSGTVMVLTGLSVLSYRAVFTDYFW